MKNILRAAVASAAFLGVPEIECTQPTVAQEVVKEARRKFMIVDLSFRTERGAGSGRLSLVSYGNQELAELWIGEVPEHKNNPIISLAPQERDLTRGDGSTHVGLFNKLKDLTHWKIQCNDPVFETGEPADLQRMTEEDGPMHLGKSTHHIQASVTTNEKVHTYDAYLATPVRSVGMEKGVLHVTGRTAQDSASADIQIGKEEVRSVVVQITKVESSE